MNDPPSERHPLGKDDHGRRPRKVPDEPAEEPAPSPPRRKLVPCWHCGKLVEPGTTACVFCRAPLGGGDLPSLPIPLGPDLGGGRLQKRLRLRPALRPMLAFFAALFLLALGFMILGKTVLREQIRQKPEETLLWLRVIREVLSTLLVLEALILVPRPPRLPKRSIEARVVAWVCGVPVLAFLLGLNLFYNVVLRELIGADESVPELLPLYLLLTVVQPAIIEELFFRYLALGTLQRYLGPHSAVLVSAVMFGVTYVGQPLSIPLLMLLGVGLGYLRVWSNGLALPMLVHFAYKLLSVLIKYA